MIIVTPKYPIAVFNFVVVRSQFTPRNTWVNLKI